MSPLVAAVVVGLVVAVLCALAAVATRRQGWTVAASGVAALALVLEAWRRGPDDRWWVLWAAPLLVVGGEVTRIAVDGRRRGTAVVLDGRVRRQAAVATVLVVAAVGIAALAVVALPARSSPATVPAATIPVGTIPVSTVEMDGSGSSVPAVLLAVGIAVPAVAVAALAVALGRLGRRRQAVGRAVPAMGLVVVALVGGALLVGAAGLVRLSPGETTSGPSATGGPAGAAADPAEFAPDDRPAPRPAPEPIRLSWWMSAILLVAFIVLIVVFGRREQLFPPEDLQPDRLVRGGVEPTLENPTRVETLDRAATLASVEQALVELRSDVDPRVAVRIAYATVAGGFGRQHLGRRPAESEGEYLQRAFAEVGAGGDALRRLTALFAVARFSDDLVDEPMRGEALAALEQIRLQVTGSVVPGREEAR